MRTKGILATIVLFSLAALVVGGTRRRLDDIIGGSRGAFREVIYIPGKNFLKIAACGFDASLADYLFVTGLIYFSEGMNADERTWRKRGYTYELFDAITDLSPRFTRGYQLGSMFLTSSPDFSAVESGIALLEKGVAEVRKQADAGRPFDADPLWLFHTLLANAYEVSLQIHYRSVGDLEAASRARTRAGEEYRKAATSPNAPGYIIAAAAGYESVLSGREGVEKSLTSMLTVLVESYEQAKRRNDESIMAYLKDRIDETAARAAAITDTRAIQELLSQAGARFLAMEKRPARHVGELIRARLVGGTPPTPLASPDRPDRWLAMPDGSFRSELLADIDTSQHLDQFIDAIVEFRKVYPGRKIEDPDVLLREGFLASAPRPPLALLGQAYVFNPEKDMFENVMPFGPEPPPSPSGIGG